MEGAHGAQAQYPYAVDEKDEHQEYDQQANGNGSVGHGWKTTGARLLRV